MTTISIITPTIGRQSLRPMLYRLLPQLIADDEVLIIGDGEFQVSQAIVAEFRHGLVRYWETEPIKNYGNPQRNMAIEQAKGDYLLFVDDDDMPSPNALSVIRSVAGQLPGRPLMFKMMHCGLELWRVPALQQGNVSGQMFVTPNVKGKIGKWSGRYEADFDFMTSTMALYPEGSLVWRPENICVQGYVGRQAGAVEMV